MNKHYQINVLSDNAFAFQSCFKGEAAFIIFSAVIIPLPALITHFSVNPLNKFFKKVAPKVPKNIP